jgi:hypothetical protein
VRVKVAKVVNSLTEIKPRGPFPFLESRPESGNGVDNSVGVDVETLGDAFVDRFVGVQF